MMVEPKARLGSSGGKLFRLGVSLYIIQLLRGSSAAATHSLLISLTVLILGGLPQKEEPTPDPFDPAPTETPDPELAFPLTMQFAGRNSSLVEGKSMAAIRNLEFA
jgi:hypothetical protein